MKNSMVGERVIIRGDRSGVFYGTLVEKKGNEVELSDCRRIWYWDGAASLSQLAKDGTEKTENCKFTVSVEQIIILDVIEIIKCTEKSTKSIEGVKIWKY